jgi:cytoskeletal protein CcmA (bactofilin family)
VAISGKVHGTVTVSEKLVLENKSILRGDIKATRLVVDEGALFDGGCKMSAEPGKVAAEPSPPKKQ